MTRIRPASRKDQDLRIDVESGLGREQVALLLRTRDQTQVEHTLETVLTWYEARQLGHALLDAGAGAAKDCLVSIRPLHKHAEDRLFDVIMSDRASEIAALRLRLPQIGDTERRFDMPLSPDEARRLGHSFLAAANPTRSASGDD